MSVKGYELEEATAYDDLSDYNKGNREMHKQFLNDFLLFLDSTPSSFLDLGCGTGVFAEEFFNLFPSINGTMLDGSSYMLKIARQRFMGKRLNKTFINERFEEIDWSNIGEIDVVFSALAIHHIEDHEKWKLFQNIHHTIAEGGVFILFDQFVTESDYSNRLLEYMACKDCQRRLVKNTGFEAEEFEINKLIEKDREVKRLEGDKESLFALQIEKLKEVGFKNVTTIFQEARFAGTVAFK